MRVLSLILAALGLSGCSPSAAPDASTKTAAIVDTPVAAFREAPELAERVAAGKLPPLRQRLPRASACP